MDNKLTVKVEDGTEKTINVLDIIDSQVYSKTFIIYSFGDEKDIYVSILNEKDSSYSLDPIISTEEIE